MRECEKDDRGTNKDEAGFRFINKEKSFWLELIISILWEADDNKVRINDDMIQSHF